MSALIALLVSFAKATTILTLLDPVLLDTTVPRALGLACPSPMVIRALQAINAPQDPQLHKSVNQVCQVVLGIV